MSKQPDSNDAAAGRANNDLLPCPFCGQEVTVSDIDFNIESNAQWINCPNPECGASGGAVAG